MSRTNITRSLSLHPELHDEIQAIAESNRRGYSAMVREMILESETYREFKREKK